jgi:hypothetical protein
MPHRTGSFALFLSQPERHIFLLPTLANPIVAATRDRGRWLSYNRPHTKDDGGELLGTWLAKIDASVGRKTLYSPQRRKRRVRQDRLDYPDPIPGVRGRAVDRHAAASWRREGVGMSLGEGKHKREEKSIGASSRSRLTGDALLPLTASSSLLCRCQSARAPSSSSSAASRSPHLAGLARAALLPCTPPWALDPARAEQRNPDRLVEFPPVSCDGEDRGGGWEQLQRRVPCDYSDGH